MACPQLGLQLLPEYSIAVLSWSSHHTSIRCDAPPHLLEWQVVARRNLRLAFRTLHCVLSLPPSVQLGYILPIGLSHFPNERGNDASYAELGTVSPVKHHPSHCQVPSRTQYFTELSGKF